MQSRGSSHPLCWLVFLRVLAIGSAPAKAQGAGWLTARLRLVVASLALLAADAGRAAAQGPDSFESRLRWFLGEHCVACHGPEVQKRRLRLDQLP
jgi:hypothetical protein